MEEKNDYLSNEPQDVSSETENVSEKRRGIPKVIQNSVPEETGSSKWKLKVSLILIVVAAVLLVFGVRLVISQSRSENPPAVITVSTLEKIIDVSDLSTFTAIYNGVAQVANEKNPEKIDYYVSYEAKVTAGIDFKDVDVTLDEEGKHIYVTLPPVTVKPPNVDISSLEYIFLNKKANTSSVSEAAYKACEEDAKKESGEENAIMVLAQENAENIIRALIDPFVKQLDNDYELEIRW